jgi:lipopolysaccharide biosynthesis protein
MKNNKKILVHIHLYYTEQLDIFLDKIKNITTDFDLFITLVEEKNEVKNKILSQYPSANIILVKNIGYDVYPFISIINNLNLDNYNYIIKMHTKRNFVGINYYLNGFLLNNNIWRDSLISFLDSTKNFNKCLQAFDNNPKLGMTGSFKLITTGKVRLNKETSRKTEVFLKQHNINTKIKYIAGTMFMARASLFKIIQNMKLGENDFKNIELKSGISATLAHILEQSFGSIVGYQGYEIKDVFSNFILLKKLGVKILKFIYQKKSENKGQIKVIRVKILSIPIYKTKKHLLK